MMRFWRRMIVASETDEGHCPHCLPALHALELVDSALGHEESIVSRYAPFNYSIDPEMDALMLPTGAVTPVMLYGTSLHYSAGNAYELNALYFRRLYSVNL